MLQQNRDIYNHYLLSMKKQIILLFICSLAISAVVTIPSFNLATGGNSWVSDGTSNVGNTGTYFYFPTVPAKFSTYFYTSSVASFTLQINLVTSVALSVTVSVGSTSLKVNIPITSTSTTYSVGTFTSSSGYNKIITSLAGTTGSGYVTYFNITGPLSNLAYVSNNIDGNYYWGRRGASCHLSPNIGSSKNISYIYSQITVPVGFDTIGSYYMANGFYGGYFGIQVNSATQRRILFSIWNLYNPNAVPAQNPNDYNIILNKKGAGVQNATFTGQGTGGQTYLVFNWTAGVTYQFLSQATPLTTNATRFTCWFNWKGNTGGWRLISQMTQPGTQTYFTGIYSFLESFNPNTGNVTRKAYYGNQWIYDSTNTWVELTSTYYTQDPTGYNNLRRDVQGGVYNGNQFYLQNDGFFNTTVTAGQTFARTANGAASKPNVTFSTLP